MNSKFRQFLLLILIAKTAVKCHTQAASEINEISSSGIYYPLTLKEADSFEIKLHSKDISFKHLLQIDTGLYPNKRAFQLTKVNRYARYHSDASLDHIIEYFASPDDSIRVILHEWNSTQNPDETNYNHSDTADRLQINLFQMKFEKLNSSIDSFLGRPHVKNITYGSFAETERDDVKWLSNDKLQGYLLMFKRDINTYRQIKLIVYPD